MVFSGGQFFGPSVAGDDCAPPGCGDAVAGFDAPALELPGAKSHAVAGTTFFVGRVFFPVLALGLVAGACVLGDWAEEGFVACGCVCSCVPDAFADEADCGVDSATTVSTDVSEEMPKKRMATARVMQGPGW